MRYLRLWRSLPDDERRARAGRVLERLLRRHRLVRKLGLLRDPPRWASFRRALDRDVQTTARRFRLPDAARGPLHVDLDRRAERVAHEHREHAAAVVEHALRLCERRFDLLGSGPARPVRSDGGLDWHRDFKSGKGWDPEAYHLDLVLVRGDRSDVKVPWELSRFQHVLVLAQACLLAPHVLGKDRAAEIERRCASEVASQIDDWMARNPRGLGVNWTCTMDVAIRAFNWLACLAMLRPSAELDDEFVSRVLRSLWVHGRHIRRNLEVGADGLTSNHYLSDVVGLYAIGCAVPELREAAEWRAFARRALVAEIERQILPDGVDFERSIPYHRLVTELVLHGALLAGAAGEPLPSAALERLALMLEFIASYTRPDGTAPQWGDNDDGRLLPLQGYATHRPHDHRHLLALGGRLLDRPDLVAAAGERTVEAAWLLDSPGRAETVAPVAWSSRAFPAAAYFVMRQRDLHLAVPCGAVGTGGLGSHSHNDLFAPCVWAGGREWLTDPGTGCYSPDPGLRNRLRATAAHGTLQLGAREQNPFGDAIDDLFRVVPRARPEVLEWRSDARGDQLAARHRGFSDERREWVHEREIRFAPGDRLWRIDDRLFCEGDSEGPLATTDRVYLRFPLSPAVGARLVEDGGPPGPWVTALGAPGRSHEPGRIRALVELRAEDEERFWIAFDLPEGAAVAVEPGIFSPRYGVSESGRVVVATLPVTTDVRARSILWSPGPHSGE
jgi:uncharacterized heparinase superfamily protein